MWQYLTNGRASSARLLVLCAALAVLACVVLVLTTNTTRKSTGSVIQKIVRLTSFYAGEDDCKHSAPEIQELSEEEQWPFGERSLSQSDPRLVDLIKKNYTIPPPVPEGGKMPEPSHWGDPAKTKYSKAGIVEEKLIPLLFSDDNGKPIRGGTFLESGSVGSHISATLYPERFLGWKGLIAEMVPLHRV